MKTVRLCLFCLLLAGLPFAADARGVESTPGQQTLQAAAAEEPLETKISGRDVIFGQGTPSITAVETDDGGIGEDLEVTITGVNTEFSQTTPATAWLTFAAATPITSSYTSYRSPTKIVANFTIPENAPIGLWSLRVRTPDNRTAEADNIVEVTLAAVQPLSPAIDATCVAPRTGFRWQAVKRAREYQLQASYSEDFSNPVIDQKTQELIYRPDEALEGNQQIYWRVVGIGDNGVTGNEMNSRFSTGLQPAIERQGGSLHCSIQDADSYQWYRDGTPIEFATESVYQVTQPGEYLVEAETFGCTMLSEPLRITVSVDDCGLVRPYISLSPNPSDGRTVVTTHSCNDAPLTIRVADVRGQEVLQFSSLMTATSFAQELDLSSLAAGVYYVHVRNGNRVKVFNFIRQ